MSKSIIARKLKFLTHSVMSSALFGNDNFPPGDARGAQRPRRKFGTPRISKFGNY